MSKAAILERELKTFAQRKAELLGSAEGQFALVYGGDVVGTYVSEADAIAEGYRKFGNVPFLVQEITEVEIPAEFVNDNVDL